MAPSGCCQRLQVQLDQRCFEIGAALLAGADDAVAGGGYGGGEVAGAAHRHQGVDLFAGKDSLADIVRQHVGAVHFAGSAAIVLPIVRPAFPVSHSGDSVGCSRENRQLHCCEIIR